MVNIKTYLIIKKKLIIIAIWFFIKYLSGRRRPW